MRRDLWPYLLGLAALLLPFDVGVRRLALDRRDLRRTWSWAVERLPRRRTHRTVEAPSPVSRLFQAKSRATTHPGEERRAAADAAESAPPPARQLRTGSLEPPAAPTPPGPPVIEGETLAGRLLRRKQERREDEGNLDV